MAGSTVSILMLARGDAPRASRSREEIERYLATTGFTFEILVLEESTYGPALRRGISEAKGGVIVVVDSALPYPVSAIGDAVAMIESGATDVVFGARQGRGGEPGALIRWMLVPDLPDTSLRLQAFSSPSAKLVAAESKLAGDDCDLEVGFLVNKYGFRVERLHVDTSGGGKPRLGPLRGLAAAFRILLTNRNMGYRAARRCPVCFSPEVWTCAQIPGNVIRACSRCKCRYLNQFGEEEETGPVRRVLRPHPVATYAPEQQHSDPARGKTSRRRIAALRKQLPAHARILEIGVRGGTFGMVVSPEYDYVGIDRAPTVARSARARGLEVYCATLANFVNTGPPFDAVVSFHVFENMADPHDALSRIKELLKPGGTLLLTTFDTEGLLYLLTERKRMAQNFRTHLILYSRSAIIELLEHSGFEIDAIGPDFEYRDHKLLRHIVAGRWPWLAPLVKIILKVLPDPLLAGTGSIRILAKRRAGPALNVRAIRSAEPTHAR
ncbi:MAG TPA: bifunctional glycosyltransferase/class I SAM-dependent methyltransferase [Thermoanaerobaculia bacterium]|nr:bifunctional glycosyltransferase/class I SAM-dependent methyltransferase [Thermoanaerobaculia bacterium]